MLKPPKRGCKLPSIIIFFILVIIISSIILYIVFFYKYAVSNHNSGSTPTPVNTFTAKPHTILNIPQSSLEIAVDAPLTMQINTSYVVRVSLVPKGHPLVSDLIVEAAHTTTSDEIPVGTPSASLKNAFGPSLTPSATADLTAPLFNLKTIGPDEQSLDQQAIVWKWAIVPIDAGQQYISTDIYCHWKAPDGIGQGPYWIGEKILAIDVKGPPPTPTPVPTSQSFVTSGQIDIGAMITSLPGVLLGTGGLGAVFILWLVNRLKKPAPQPPAKKRKARKRP